MTTHGVLDRGVASPDLPQFAVLPTPDATPEAVETEFLDRKQGKVANHSEKCGNDRGATMTYRLSDDQNQAPPGWEEWDAA